MTRAVRGDEGGADVSGEAGEHRFEDIASQCIGVFARRETLRASPIVAAPSTPTHSTCSAAAGLRLLENCPRSMQAWTSASARGGGLLEELETLEVLAEAGHRAVEEHQREVFGVRFRELVERPHAPAQPLERIVEVTHRTKHTVTEDAEALLGEREEDVVLAREVAVDRGGAVFDAIGDLPHRNVAGSPRR